MLRGENTRDLFFFCFLFLSKKTKDNLIKIVDIKAAHAHISYLLSESLNAIASRGGG